MSKNYTDKLFACQPIINLLTDKQIPCQAYQKAKKIHALTRKTHVEAQKNRSKWLKLFIADKYFTCQWYRKIKIFWKKIQISLPDK